MVNLSVVAASTYVQLLYMSVYVYVYVSQYSVCALI